MIANLLADIERRGVKLFVVGDRIRFHPADRMTPELIDRLKARKPEVLTALSPKPDGGKANSPEARTSDPATVDELQVVEQRDAPAGLLGDDTASPTDCRTLPTYSEAQGVGVIQSSAAATNGPSAENFAALAHARGNDVAPTADPAPCPTCGNPIYWLLPTGNVACKGCVARPAGVTLQAIVITLPNDRLAWEVESIGSRKNLR